MPTKKEILSDLSGLTEAELRQIPPDVAGKINEILDAPDVPSRKTEKIPELRVPEFRPSPGRALRERMEERAGSIFRRLLPGVAKPLSVEAAVAEAGVEEEKERKPSKTLGIAKELAQEVIIDPIDSIAGGFRAGVREAFTAPKDVPSGPFMETNIVARIGKAVSGGVLRPQNVPPLSDILGVSKFRPEETDPSTGYFTTGQKLSAAGLDILDFLGNDPESLAVIGASPAVLGRFNAAWQVGKKASALRDLRKAAPLLSTLMGGGEEAKKLLATSGLRSVDDLKEAVHLAQKERIPRTQTMLDALPGEVPSEISLKGEHGWANLAETTKERVSTKEAVPGKIVGDPVRRSEIVRFLGEKLGVPIRTGRIRMRRVLGFFRRPEKVIRLTTANDLDTLSHEVGHLLDNELGLGALKGKTDKFDDELIVLGARTSRKGYTKNQVRAEGVAEFTRLYLTDVDASKAIAPRYFASFEEALDRTPEIREVLLKSRADIKRYVDQPSTAKILGHISRDEDFAHKPSIRETWYTNTVDRLYPIKKAVEELRRMERAGRATPELLMGNAYTLARTYAGWMGTAETFLRHGTLSFNTLKKVGKSFHEITEPILDRMDDFSVYAVSRRAVELNRRGIKTGLKIEDVNQALKELSDPVFTQTFDDLTRFQDEVLQYTVDGGVLSPEQYKAIRKMNQDYIPFHRVFENQALGGGNGGTSFANVFSPVRRIKGSGRDIVDPMESILKNTLALIKATEQNEVVVALARQVSATKGAARFMTEIPIPLKPTTLRMEELSTILKNALKGEADELVNDLVKEMSKEELSSLATIFRPSTIAPKGDNVLSGIVNGQRKFYETEPALYKATLGMDAEVSGKLVKLLSHPAKWLRAGATGLNPDFVISNLWRDNLGAFIQSKYGFKPGVDFTRGFFSMVNRDELYWQYKAAGGDFAAITSLDRDHLQKMKKSLLRQKMFTDYVNPVEAMRLINETVEKAPRIGEFAKARAALGGSRAALKEAALAARDVTIDFSRMGAKTQALNSMIAFFNPAIQGVDKMARTFRANPTGASIKAATSVTIPSLLFYALGRDDPDIQEIPREMKDRYWFMRVSDEKIVRIPKPFEWGILFGSYAERVFEYIDKKDPSAFDDVVKNTLDTLSPNVIPNVAQPLLENYANWDIYGRRPVVPKGKERLLPYLQANAWTSETAKAAGKQVRFSPAKIENVVQGWTGGLGRYGLTAMDAAGQAFGVLPVPPSAPDKGVSNVPVLRSFVIEPKRRDSIDKFYSALETYESLHASARDVVSRGDQAEIADFTSKYAKPLRAYAQVRLTWVTTQQVLSDLRTARDRIYQDPDMTPERKKKLIMEAERNMSDLAREAIKVLKEK